MLAIRICCYYRSINLQCLDKGESSLQRLPLALIDLMTEHSRVLLCLLKDYLAFGRAAVINNNDMKITFMVNFFYQLNEIIVRLIGRNH